MRLMGLVLLLLAAASPAVAESADTSVTVLRGASAPPVVEQTVVYPEIVYLPTYYPAYSFYPGYFIQPRRFMHQQVSARGLPHSHK
jgi:hypothetical protein